MTSRDCLKTEEVWDLHESILLALGLAEQRAGGGCPADQFLCAENAPSTHPRSGPEQARLSRLAAHPVVIMDFKFPICIDCGTPLRVRGGDYPAEGTIAVF